ncbi:MAG: ComF family protein, putative [Microgenomates bacterium 39_7]|nr:MAG: ComF family protein, putative [Microgenomates bacterium 39_7]
MNKNFFVNLFNNTLDVFLPPHCVCCRKNGSLLCKRCYRLIHFKAQSSSRQLINSDFLDQVLTLAIYQPPISNLIQELKYKKVKKVAQLMAEMFYLHLRIPQTDIITWAPISIGRLNNRGFNQAELIARELSDLIEVPAVNLLIKTKETKKQARSSLQERITNLNGIFAFNPIFNKHIGGASVLIVDDVISTGSTLNECAKVLKTNKASKVIGLTVAQS